MQKKQLYVAPAIEVIGLENEGVIAASGSSNGGNESYGESTMSFYRNSASSSDLEDMINDIFTVEQ